MVLFYKHINSQGGVPSEIRSFVKLNKKKNDFIVINSYKELIRNLIKSRFDIEIVFVGFFFINYLFFWTLFIFTRTKYSIWGLGQISPYSINKDIFTTSPIISEMSTQVKHKYRKSYVKPFFLYITRFLFKLYKPNFWVFSEYERRHIENYFGKIYSRNAYWVCADNIKSFNESDIPSELKKEYPDKHILLCWSRIDINTKGIDRFYELTASIKKRTDNYLSIVCGPHYSGNLSTILNCKNWIVKNTLDSSKSFVDFLDADFIVLLSRWDGFPRVLREALVHYKPIIVSPETHFAEIVTKYNVGIVCDSNYDVVIDQLLNFNRDKCDFSGAIQAINEPLEK